MKKCKYKYRLPKYGEGGTTSGGNSDKKDVNWGAIGAASGMAATVGGELLASNPYNSNGSVNDGRYIAGKALSRAGSGVATGAAFGPWGMLAGGAAGLGVGLYEGITGSKKMEKDREAQMAAQEEAVRVQQEREAEMKKQEEEYQKQQQMAWNQSYAVAHPELKGTAASLYGQGGLLPITNDISKAEGARHEQGGILLQANGKPIAEVEDDEIIQGDRVFSDRRKIGGKTYAEHAEKLAKEKAKFEDMANSMNYRDSNTGERMMANIDLQLDRLFTTQEASKKTSPVRQGASGARRYDGGGYFEPTSSRGFSPSDDREAMLENAGYTPTPEAQGKGGYNWMRYLPQAAGMVAPFIDNIYNKKIIDRTPEVPKPTSRIAYNQTAMPMKTSIDITKPLADVNNYYRDFRSNVDNYTSNSTVGRNNKLAAYARVLDARGNLFSDKEKAESGLINQNNMNLQAVNNANIRNKQDITNQNYALVDQYNWDKTMREDNMLKARAQNVANATGDAMKLTQDLSARQLDKDRVMIDALRYNGGAGYARLIGTPMMDEMMRDPAYYDQVEKSLRESGQTAAYNSFIKRYGRGGSKK